MDISQLGIGSFAYRYQAGFPGCMPDAPLTPLSFIDDVQRLGLKRLQLCENIRYADSDTKAIGVMVNRVKELGLAVEIGMNGVTRENLRKHIKLAKEFESKFIRSVIGVMDPDENKAVPIIVQNIKSVLNELRDNEISLGLENYFDNSTQQIVQVIKDVNDPLVGSVFDSTNCIGFIERPMDALALMLPHIKSMHLKDYRMVKTEAGITMVGQVLGQGVLDVKAILKKVLAMNPQASIIIELTIKRTDGLSVTEVIEEEKRHIVKSVEYAKKVCTQL